MQLQNQVSSLEFSKKLKELGVKQESLFYWIKLYDGTIILNHSLMREHSVAGDLYQQFPSVKSNKYSAFTVAELGEMLPRDYMSFHNSIGKWFCEDLDTFIQPEYKANDYNTEADARAKMLIYLIFGRISMMNL